VFPVRLPCSKGWRNTRNEKKDAHLEDSYNVYIIFVSETGGVKTGP
jgi:hypothetical protein